VAAENPPQRPHAIRAVIFDLGGVVFDSPLHEIARFEATHQLPPGFINRVVAATGPTGTWARLERGELHLDDFYDSFGRDCEASGHAVDARALMERIAGTLTPRPRMLAAIATLRAQGFKVAALTNNWVGTDGPTASGDLGSLFDVIVESSAVGLHKPDPRIYELACVRLGITPREAVFLDDIGRNLKTARALGMRTIKVDDPERALMELEGVLGLRLHERAG
jgi:putative hydrolase of the HAD superfamily